VDLSASVQGHAGIGRYATELLKALVDLAGDDEFATFHVDRHRRTPPPPLDRLPGRSLAWPNKIWRASVLAAELAGLGMDRLVGKTDLFHATDNVLPTLRDASTVFTLHDLVHLKYPETVLPMNRSYLRVGMPRFLARADAVIAVSEATRRDAIELLGVPPGKVQVVHSGISPIFRPALPEQIAEIRERYGLPEHCLLFVGSIEPRKNLGLLFRCLPRLRRPGLGLVVAGSKGWNHEAALAGLHDSGAAEMTRFIGTVSDEHLPALYSAAELLVFPSLYEGFGFPVLEAMLCGTPVVTSDRGSLSEVAGEAAVALPPDDADTWTETITALLDDLERQEDLKRRGLAWAERFTWRQTAAKTLEVYRRITGGVTP
jgi:glycosyltransferase involved in cell wall biosynthesis